MIVSRPTSRGSGWATATLLDGFDSPPAIAVLDDDLSFHLPGGKFLFPAIVDDHVDVRTPLWNYVFVLAVQPDRELLQLERSRFITRLIRMPGSPQVDRTTDWDLSRMLATIPRYSMRVGARVHVVLGQYTGLDGTLRGVSGAKVRVGLVLKSCACEIVLDKGAVRPLPRE